MVHYAAEAMIKLGEDNLHQALSLGHTINARNNAGETPIMKYISLGNPEGIQIFQNLGADLFATNNAGETLLHILARAPTDVHKRIPFPWGLYRTDGEKVVECFKYLLGLGLDPSLEDRGSRTAMVSLPSLFTLGIRWMYGLLTSVFDVPRMLRSHIGIEIFWDCSRRRLNIS
jgi:hypothetical protein